MDLNRAVGKKMSTYVGKRKKRFGIDDSLLKKKYAEAKKRLHIVSPAEYKGLKDLMNYYYQKMIDRGLI